MRTTGKRLLSILLCLCIAACMLPTVAFAADTGKAIQLVDSGTAANISGGQADNIYFGTWEEKPIKWRVLDNQTNTGESGLFLLSDALLGTGGSGDVYFDNSGNNSNVWRNSTAKTWCNNFYASSFSNGEPGAVLATTKSDKEFMSSTNPFIFAASENILNGDKVFFLSAEEAENSTYGFTDDNARIANYGNSAGVWWLRSPFSSDDGAAGVVDCSYNGAVHVDIVRGCWAARPAFNLNLNAVLFTSAAVGGKSATGMDSALTAIPAYAGNEWKLTLLDNSRNFAVTETTASGKPDGTVALNYTGANTGENEYISVIIEQNDEMLYYGRVAQPDGESGTVNVTIPADLAPGSYTLNLFSEQYNGDYKTDYASNFDTVALTVEEDAPVPVPGTGKTIMAGTSGIKDPTAEGSTYYTPNSYIYFGKNGDTPIKWRVLDADKTNDGSRGAFLLSEHLLGNTKFNENNSNIWQNSIAQQWCSTFASTESNFSPTEQGAMLGVEKTDNGESKLYSFVWSASSLTKKDKMFFLSAKELADYVGSYDKAPGLVAKPDGGSAGVWWLRSPIAYSTSIYAGAVSITGAVNGIAVDSVWAARPAFNLNLASVLFTSAAANGKPDGLNKIGDYDGNEWKLTLLDNSRNFAAATTAVTGDTLTLSYSGAATGANEYISAIIKDNSGNITHYGRLKNTTEAADASGTVNIDLSGVTMAATDTLYVFSEQYNGGAVDNTKLTDYASALVEVSQTKNAYTLTVDLNGGSGSTTGGEYAGGAVINIDAGSRSNYRFDGWTSSNGGSFADASSASTTFTMPAADTAVTANWRYIGGGGSTTDYYRLTFETNGGSSISSITRAEYTTIDLTLDQYIPTREGWAFTGWYADEDLTEKITSIRLTRNTTVYAGWEKIKENPGTGANPFTDVNTTDWFYNDVMFVYEKGLMLGTSKTLFSPHGTATRGMMATILWRMEGSPAPKGKNSFTDVETGKWYADAITWTAENGIFAGYGKDKFGPDDPITREQLAAIFYRYADYKGYDLTVKGKLDKFKDADKITDYAKTAMGWAVGSGLVKGKSGSLLDPQGTATRAEIAAMLHRFIEKYELVQGKAPGGLMGWIDPKRLQIPKTGDSSALGLWGFTLCASLAGCLALTTAQLRRKREEEALQIIEK